MNAATSEQKAYQYLVQQIQTASREQLLLMLYDGAIRFLKLARKALDTKDYETSHNNLLKSQKILTELMSSLDMNVGGEVARNLMNLYEYLYYRLVQANLKRDPEMVDEVIGHLTDLRKTWDEAIKIAAREHQQTLGPDGNTADGATLHG